MSRETRTKLYTWFVIVVGTFTMVVCWWLMIETKRAERLEFEARMSTLERRMR